MRREEVILLEEIDMDEGDDYGGLPEKEYATAEESRAAVESLSDEDYLKLMVIARSFCRRRRLGADQCEPGELLNEAVSRTLAHDRRWPKGVISIVRHLDRAMESISGHAVAHAKVKTNAIAQLAAEDVGRHPDEPHRFTRATAEERLIYAEHLGEIETAFAGAPTALAVLMLRAKGYSEPEIKVRLGITSKQYESARKKIEREFVKHAFSLEGVIL
jgi:hypothetical protein